MLNNWIGIGRLVRDPELCYTNSGKPVAFFTIAVERSYQNQGGEKEVDFIDIVVWQKLAEICAKHLGKGRLVCVVGRLQIRKNKTDDRTYINPEIIANEIKFLDWPKDEEKETKQESNVEQEDDFDVPF